jgi:transcriptional antiterminator RfaH
MNPELLTPHELQTGEREVKRWYLAYTKPRLEQLALVNLKQQGFEAYLPLYKKITSSKDGIVEGFEPMFPRYILFRPGQPQQSISTVNHTKGVSNIVRFGFEPASLTNDVVVLIRKLETERNQTSSHELSQLKSGQKVLLKHTALKGMEGIIQTISSKRVAVLLEILGRPTLVKVEHHQVQVAN